MNQGYRLKTNSKKLSWTSVPAFLMVGVAFILISCSGCSQNDSGYQSPEVKPETNPAPQPSPSVEFSFDTLPPVVSGAYAAAALDRPARDFVLVGTGKAADRFGNAIEIQWEDYAQRIDGVPGMSLTPEELNAAFVELGLAKDQNIIVVGDGVEGWGEEGRILWLLNLAGYTSLAVVDGGSSALRNRSQGFVGGARPTPDDIPLPENLSFEDVQQGLEQFDVLDVRTGDEFEGDTPYGSPRGGHVPGAQHFHIEDFFDDSGLFLNAELLKQKLSERGIDGDKPIVTYCTGGVRSALATYLIRHVAGFAQTYNYDGSWWEWSRRAD